MDGVLWLGDSPLAGLKEFFARLEDARVAWVLATNNSSRTPEQYAAKLAGYGIAVDPGRILTSARVAAAYLAGQAPAGTPVYLIGGEGLRLALAEHGFVFSETEARFVVVGWDRELTWKKLARASLLIHSGARFIGTNPDLSYPTAEGPVPGCGAQLKAIEAATGTPPLVLGKPGGEMYRQALELLGTAPAETAMLGDRIDTDLAGAEKMGMKTILVLSGTTPPGSPAIADFSPDLICSDIGELARLWGGS